MLTNRPVVTTIPAVDLNRALSFYQDTLGLMLESTPFPGYAMLKAGNDTQIMLYERAPSHCDHTAAAFEVEDIEAEMRELKAKGVNFEEYDMPGLKTVNGIATMNGSKSAWFKDTEGNILSLSQM